MRTRTLKSFVSAIALGTAMAALPAVALAQDAADDDTIVVTGSRIHTVR